MQNRPWPWTVAACAILILMAGCRVKEQNPPAPVPPVPLVSLSVSPVDWSIAPGTTVQYTAIGTFADNSERNVTTSVTWGSSDPSVTISNEPGSQGLATSITGTGGSTVISAVAEGITKTTALTISHVSTITVTPPMPPCIAPGTTQQFSASGTLVDGTQQNLTSFATWTSLDLGFAIVSDTAGSKGLATAVAPGIASIQATYDSVSSSASLSSSAVASIATSPTSASTPKGTTQQFTAIGTLTNNCNTQDVTSLATWATSSTGVAMVSDKPGSKGLATAVDVGTATITAAIDSVPSSSATLTVTQAVLVSIAVSPANPRIALGKTQQFIAIGTFTDSTTHDLTSLVTWNSSHTGVATISNISGSRGVATSQAEGTTTITASFSGISSNNATLTITPAELLSITVVHASVTISLSTGKNSEQFKATGTFTDGSTQDLTTSVNWVSTNPNIPISNSGKAVNTFFLLESTDITASLSGITSNTATLTFTP